MYKIKLNDETTIEYSKSETSIMREKRFYLNTDKSKEELKNILTEDNLAYLRLCTNSGKVFGKYYNMYCYDIIEKNSILCARIFPIGWAPIDDTPPEDI